MSHYRRLYRGGGCYFFTVVAYLRRPILCDDGVRAALREGIMQVRERHPFVVDAWVLMPDHLHCIWTLPEGDDDYSIRWSQIKRHVSLQCGGDYHDEGKTTSSRRKRRESTIWQRRFWDHCIRDQQDFNHHADYIHYNPVKHGLCSRPDDWPYSTVHRYMQEGLYADGWNNEPTDIEGAE